MTTTEQFYRALAMMPPLRHKVGDPFDIEQSEVVAWLLRQPELKQWLFNKVSDTRRIVYDEATGTWSGAPFRPIQKGWKEKRIMDGWVPGTGGRPKRFKDEEILAMLDGRSSGELAKAKDCSRTTMHTILCRLRDEGKAVCGEDRGWRRVEDQTPKPTVEVVEVDV